MAAGRLLGAMVSKAHLVVGAGGSLTCPATGRARGRGSTAGIGGGHAAARSVNAVMTATYWEIGRRIVEYEQGGKARAGYGEALITRLAGDLGRRFGRGFSRQNLQIMRSFYRAYPADLIRQTASGGSRVVPMRQTASGNSAGEAANIVQTLSAESGPRTRPAATPTSGLAGLAARFPLPWSHYVRLLGVRSEEARKFYEAEALRGGWTVRQLDRQIGSQFYERTALSRNKAAMLEKGGHRRPVGGQRSFGGKSLTESRSFPNRSAADEGYDRAQNPPAGRLDVDDVLLPDPTGDGTIPPEVLPDVHPRPPRTEGRPPEGMATRRRQTMSRTKSGNRLTGAGVRTSASGPSSSMRPIQLAIVAGYSTRKRAAVCDVFQPRAALSARMASRPAGG